MIRNEAVKGRFYEDNSKNLLKELDSCFGGRFGCELSSSKRKGKVLGIISPHAGYVYSGMCASHGFNEIRKHEVSDIYFFIGPNHYAFNSAFSCVDWKTPLGVLKCDESFVKEISKLTKISIDEYAHEKEHSIEVQLPFLQYVNRGFEDKFKIVCLTLSNDINVFEVGKKIKNYVSKSGKTVTFIISSDFTHFGSRFGYVPFEDNIKKNIYNLDNSAINFILKKDSKGFVDYVDKTGVTICGFVPISLFLNLVGNEEKGLLLCYYTSSDISNDENNSVSYVSICFY